MICMSINIKNSKLPILSHKTIYERDTINQELLEGPLINEEKPKFDLCVFASSSFLKIKNKKNQLHKTSTYCIQSNYIIILFLL